MKKLITLLLALAMVLSLTACGEQPTGATGDDGNTVSAESDGRTLYEAAIQLACDGDFPGSIEGLKKAVAAEETDDWTSWDIMTAWLRMAQIYRLQGDAEGEAQVKADYQAATGEELPFLNEHQFDGTSPSAYFQESLITDASYGILVYGQDGSTMTLEEYRAAGPVDTLSDGSLRLGERVDFSFLGITSGMTREQVYDALEMTDWARTVTDHLNFVDFSFYVDVTGEYFTRSLVVSTQESDRDTIYIRIYEMEEDNYLKGGLVILNFENDTLMEGANGMIYFGA
ncbi:MAG: hypothetical protein EGQ29_05175 [Clostridiales bacterium]|nr:hypothetical protein [Clostridiales bacterium]